MNLEELKRDHHVNPIGCKSDYFSKRVANTRHLSRILMYLSEVIVANYTTILRYTGISALPDALNFLKNHKLIEKTSIACKSACHYYYLPEFKDEAINILNSIAQNYMIERKLKRTQSKTLIPQIP